MASAFLAEITRLLLHLAESQEDRLQAAADAMATSLTAGGVVYFYGSGHSAIPALDVFPRYGTYVGLQPIHDPRLLWFNVLGPGGVRELLWLERQEGYVANVLRSYPLGASDTVVVYSHGGVNAAPVEAALLSRDRGATVVGVTSLDGIESRAATHSSGKLLADVADICIDTCAPAADALVAIEGLDRPVSASSTVLTVAVTMELVARAAAGVVHRGGRLDVFASPVAAADGRGNDFVFESYRTLQRRLQAVV